MTEATAPTTPGLDTLLADIEQRHVQDVQGWDENWNPVHDDFCQCCQQAWPCDAILLAKALRLAVTGLRWYADDENWADGIPGRPDGWLDWGEHATDALTTITEALHDRA